jgi:hypothetical protein
VVGSTMGADVGPPTVPGSPGETEIDRLSGSDSESQSCFGVGQFVMKPEASQVECTAAAPATCAVQRPLLEQ